MMYGPDRALWVIIREIYLLALCRLLSPCKINTFSLIQIMEENRKEIVSDAYIYNTLGSVHTLTHALKSKQMDGNAHMQTHTHVYTYRESMLFL